MLLSVPCQHLFSYELACFSKQSEWQGLSSTLELGTMFGKLDNTEEGPISTWHEKDIPKLCIDIINSLLQFEWISFFYLILIVYRYSGNFFKLKPSTIRILFLYMTSPCLCHCSVSSSSIKGKNDQEKNWGWMDWNGIANVWLNSIKHGVTPARRPCAIKCWVSPEAEVTQGCPTGVSAVHLLSPTG